MTTDHGAARPLRARPDAARGRLARLRATALAGAGLAVLAACGVEGPPQPREATPPPGVSVTGDARMGITGRF